MESLLTQSLVKTAAAVSVSRSPVLGQLRHCTWHAAYPSPRSARNVSLCSMGAPSLLLGSSLAPFLKGTQPSALKVPLDSSVSGRNMGIRHHRHEQGNIINKTISFAPSSSSSSSSSSSNHSSDKNKTYPSNTSSRDIFGSGALPANQSGLFQRREDGHVSPWELSAVGGSRSFGALTNGEAPSAPYTWPEGSRRPRVCILGGGFGGLYTALRLDSLIWTPERRPQVLLVDQSDRFVFKPMLYELLTKEVTVWEIAPTFRDLLKDTHIQFLQSKVASVDPKNDSSSSNNDTGASSSAAPGGRILLEDGSELEYDWLVLSLGAETKMSFVPGAQNLALPFSTLQHALAVDQRLTELEREQFARGTRSPIRVLVVGAGYSGVELSCVVAERLGDRGEVSIVDPSETVCSSAPAANRDAATKALQEKNVQFRLETRVASMSLSPSSSSPSSPGASAPSANHKSESTPIKVQLTSNGKGEEGSWEEEAEFDIVLWTVGNTPVMPPPSGVASGAAASAHSGGSAGGTPFPLTGRGQAEVEQSLRVRSHPHVFALGDAAAYVAPGSERPLPGTAQVAFQQADYVGWNIWASINGRPLLPFRYQHLGEMMVLGSDEGAVSVGFLDNFFLGGRLAHTARKLAYLYRLPTFGHQTRVGASWLGKAVVDTIAQVQGGIVKAFFSQK